MYVFFDLDGTILDTLEDLYLSMNHTLEHYGYPTRTKDEIRLFTGEGMVKLMERSLPDDVAKRMSIRMGIEEASKTAIASALADLHQRFYHDFTQYYLQHNLDHTKPYPGILQILQTLKDEGHILGVASNKADESVQPLVGRFYPKLFDAVTGAFVDKPKKPHPFMIERLFDQLGVSVNALSDADVSPNTKTPTTLPRMVYVGDSEVDMQTACSVHAELILCDWGFRTRKQLLQTGAQASSIVSTPDALLTKIHQFDHA